MKEYVEISMTPTPMVVDGSLGLQNLYKIKRVYTAIGAVDLSMNRYYYSKELGQVVSCRGRSSKARVLELDQYGNYTLQEKAGEGFRRPFKVSRELVLHAMRGW